MKNNISNFLRYSLCIASLFGATLHAQDKAPGSYDGPKEKLHIYLLIGQSNMAGRAPFTEEEAGGIPGCYLFTRQDTWEPAKNPLNRHSTIRKGLGMQRLNPGYSFAKTMLEKDKSISIGLVVNAKGGSNIGEWTQDSTFYKEAVSRTRSAMETGELKGVLGQRYAEEMTNVQTK